MSEASTMNIDHLEGTYKQVVGMAKQRWGKITHNDYLIIAGVHDEKRGKVQYRRGIAKQIADRTVQAWR
jgi:uncharacterized protein YjbJ (UPF0337 family)